MQVSLQLFISQKKPLPIKTKKKKVYKTIVSVVTLLQYFQPQDKNSRCIWRYIYRFLRYFKIVMYLFHNFSQDPQTVFCGTLFEKHWSIPMHCLSTCLQTLTLILRLSFRLTAENRSRDITLRWSVVITGQSPLRDDTANVNVLLTRLVQRQQYWHRTQKTDHFASRNVLQQRTGHPTRQQTRYTVLTPPPPRHSHNASSFSCFAVMVVTFYQNPTWFMATVT
jgi:hypothetical protein